MTADAGTSQALVLLGALLEQVDRISDELEVFETPDPPQSARGLALRQRRSLHLRRDLYEAHRLIEGIYTLFPETLPDHRRSPQVACGAQPVDRQVGR